MFRHLGTNASNKPDWNRKVVARDGTDKEVPKRCDLNASTDQIEQENDKGKTEARVQIGDNNNSLLELIPRSLQGFHAPVYIEVKLLPGAPV